MPKYMFSTKNKKKLFFYNFPKIFIASNFFLASKIKQFNFDSKKLLTKKNLLALKIKRKLYKKIKRNVNVYKKIKFFVPIKKESIIKRNNYLDFKIKNFNWKSDKNLILVKKNLFRNFTFNIFIKNKFFSKFYFTKQEVYLLNDVIFSLNEDFLVLLKYNLGYSYLVNINLSKIIVTKILLKFINWNFFGTLQIQKHFILYIKYFVIKNNNLNLINYFCYRNNFYNFKKELLRNTFDSVLTKNFENLIFNDFKKSTLNLNLFLKQSYFKSFFEGKVDSLSILRSNIYFLNYLKQNFYINSKNLNQVVWKKNNNSLNNILLNSAYKKVFKRKLKFLYFLSKNIIFVLFKLNEKSSVISTNLIAKKRLKLLLYFLILKLKNKILLKNSKTFGVSKSKFKLMGLKWYFIFRKKILKLYKYDNNIKNKNSASVLLVERKIRKKSFLKFKKIKLIHKKLKNVNSILNSTQLNNIISYILKNNISLFFINTLTLAHFSFLLLKENKFGKDFLRRIDRDMIAKYKYIAVYIQDLVRISFISLFFKNPTFLATFMGFQISKLPKNRKETKFLRFIIKLIRIFSSQKKEMIGVKIEFKGRINRWRRTKILRGVGGLLPSLYDYKTKVEYGSSKSITRKGALGIRLWFCYKSYFTTILRRAILKYFLYSKYLHLYTIKKFLHKYKSI